jgi:hypothetical protein
MTPAEKFTGSTYDTLLRLDFVSFAQRCLCELSPRSQFAINWHIEIIAAKLMALRAGKIRRLIINKAYITEIIECIFHPAVLGRPIASLGGRGGGVSRNVCGETTWTRRQSHGARSTARACGEFQPWPPTACP